MAMIDPPQAMQRLVELAERAEMMEFLRESRADLDAGRTEPALEALERLAKKRKLNDNSGGGTARSG
jgi:hypothetical protein